MNRTDKEWDPLPSERIYFRNKDTGDLGWLVRREGRDKVKLDRATEDICRNFNHVDWIPEKEHRPISEAQMAMVAFESDRTLCRYIGLPDKAKKEWLNLNDNERILWMRQGPDRPPVRAELWLAVMDVLRRYVGEDES